jgi:hypothetical protein
MSLYHHLKFYLVTKFCKQNPKQELFKIIAVHKSMPCQLNIYKNRRSIMIQTLSTIHENLNEIKVFIFAFIFLMLLALCGLVAHCKRYGLCYGSAIILIFSRDLARNFSSQTFSRINIISFVNLVILHLPAYEDGTDCSETSAYKMQTPGNYPEENLQHSEHGESVK